MKVIRRGLGTVGRMRGKKTNPRLEKKKRVALFTGYRPGRRPEGY